MIGLMIAGILAILVFALMFWLLFRYARRIEDLEREIDNRNFDVYRAQSDRRRMADALVRSEEDLRNMTRVLDHVIFEREAAYVSLNMVLEDQLTIELVQSMRRLSVMARHGT